MIEYSREQARAKGLLRKSTEHGDEEWRAIVADTFNFKQKKTEKREESGSFEMEAQET